VNSTAIPAADFYSADEYRPDQSVGYLMKRIVLSIMHQADLRLEVHGLTSAQWGPLLKIKAAGRATVAELARWLQVDAGAMTRLLDRLEKKGLCKRVRCTDDRRVVYVELTPEGEASIVDVPAVLCDVLNDHLAGFSRAEWQQMRGYLQRMLANGESMRDAA
jgi:DNA-binding MarR family transcriptional regulator